MSSSDMCENKKEEFQQKCRLLYKGIIAFSTLQSDSNVFSTVLMKIVAELIMSQDAPELAYAEFLEHVDLYIKEFKQSQQEEIPKDLQ